MSNSMESIQNNNSETLTPFHQQGILDQPWSIWWRFNSRGSYSSDLLQPVFHFNNLNEFSQIYNSSPLGKVSTIMNPPQKTVSRTNNPAETDITNIPIDCIMLFRHNIRPEWEDPKNANGCHFLAEFLNSNLDQSDILWKN